MNSDDFEDFLDNNECGNQEPEEFDNFGLPIENGEDNPFFLVSHKGMFYPAPLKKGDKIALLSPASVVKEEYVFGAMSKIKERGYEPVLMPYAIGHQDGSFAATKGERLIDLIDALENSDIKAILCTRGGYGCSQVIGNFSYGMIANNPKWIIGFSDISALLALWYRSNIASIHGPMAKHISTMPENDPCTEALFRMLENGGRFDYTIAPHEFNRKGKVKGILRGGNMAVLNDLAATPYDILNPESEKENIILFFEDINEPIYKVNRMLWRLINTGCLEAVKGIIFGQFTEYRPDANFQTMEEMINHFVERSIIPPSIPIVYNFPVGHTDLNYPLTEGAKVELEVSDTEVRLHTIF